MPAPYSKDLRTRALAAAADRGDADLAEVARRFNISESILNLWRRIQREEGRVEAKPHSGGPAPKLKAAEETWLREAVAEKNDCTLEEYGLRLGEATGTTVSISTLSRGMKRLSSTLSN
jgi:transposase